MIKKLNKLTIIKVTKRRQLGGGKRNPKSTPKRSQNVTKSKSMFKSEKKLFQIVLEPSWAILDRSWAILAGLGALLGRFWAGWGY